MPFLELGGSGIGSIRRGVKRRCFVVDAVATERSPTYELSCTFPYTFMITAVSRPQVLALACDQALQRYLRQMPCHPPSSLRLSSTEYHGTCPHPEPRVSPSLETYELREDKSNFYRRQRATHTVHDCSTAYLRPSDISILTASSYHCLLRHEANHLSSADGQPRKGGQRLPCLAD